MPTTSAETAFWRRGQAVPSIRPVLILAFTQYPVLEPSFLYGGYPFKELRNKFLMAQPSGALPLTPEVLPEGLEMMAVNGHSFSMSAIKTDDGVWFLADCLTGRKYP